MASNLYTEGLAAAPPRLRLSSTRAMILRLRACVRSGFMVSDSDTYSAGASPDRISALRFTASSFNWLWNRL